VRPEFLLLIGAFQANLPYLLWRFGYPISNLYRSKFHITYRPLYLWVLVYLAFWLGTVHVRLCMCRKYSSDGAVADLGIQRSLFHVCAVFFICVILLQIVIICRLYGVFPLLAYFTDYNVSALEEAKEQSGFGQLGLLSLSLFMLDAIMLVGIVAAFRIGGWSRLLLRVGFLIAVVGALYTGKTQAFFMFACMLFTGPALLGLNPVNALLRRFGYRSLSGRTTLFAIIAFFFFLVFLHGFTRWIRVHADAEFGIRYSVDKVIDYFAWPLMNMERQIEAVGYDADNAQAVGILQRLLPWKLQAQFMQNQKVSRPPRVERTSPAGFMEAIHWYLGLGWMLVFTFGVGLLCKWFYVQSAKSLFCLLAYSQIAWALVAAHSYNHFLNLVFVPLPIMGFFPLAKLLSSTRVIGVLRTCAYRARYAA